jgi:hypothetical protein
MMFTSSDASSLVRELWWWEHAEYVFGALVAAACAGEYIADFNKRPWVKARKDRIAKISTLVLVAALVFELICITRANGKSDEVIGKLRDEAAAADILAQSAVQNSNTALGTSVTALSQAKDALTKSGKAEDSLGKAEDEANKAQNASSNARTLASSARREADSFERDIVSAKQQAAEAESHLAGALERAASAERESAKLTNRFADRTLTDAQLVAIADKLKPFVGQEFEFSVYWDLREPMALANRILAALNLAGWTYIRPGKGWLLGGVSGVTVYVHHDAVERTRRAADSLAAALNAEGIPAEFKTESDPGHPDNKINIMIGTKL